MTDKTVGELEVLIAVKDKANQHPHERRVSTHLTNDNVQRLHRPHIAVYLPRLLERVLKPIVLYEVHVLHGTKLVQNKVLPNVEPVQGRYVEPDEVVYADCSLLQRLNDSVWNR